MCIIPFIVLCHFVRELRIKVLDSGCGRGFDESERFEILELDTLPQNYE